jgi:uncharacterized protein (TIGR00369 family)
MSMPVRTSLLQETGIVHGALVAALADTAAVYLVFPDLPEDQTMAAIEFKLNFLRPGLPHGGDLEARARLVQRGSRVVVCDVDVLQRRRHIARAVFSYLVFPKLNPKSSRGPTASRTPRPR